MVKIFAECEPLTRWYSGCKFKFLRANDCTTNHSIHQRGQDVIIDAKSTRIFRISMSWHCNFVNSLFVLSKKLTQCWHLVLVDGFYRPRHCNLNHNNGGISNSLMIFSVVGVHVYLTLRTGIRIVFHPHLALRWHYRLLNHYSFFNGPPLLITGIVFCV